MKKSKRDRSLRESFFWSQSTCGACYPWFFDVFSEKNVLNFQLANFSLQTKVCKGKVKAFFSDFVKS